MASRYKFSEEQISEIAKAYQSAAAHPVSKGQIYCVLHRHGWRKVMPRSKHPKKAGDEEIKVVDRLCDTICSLSSRVISSITGRDWVIKLFN